MKSENWGLPKFQFAPNRKPGFPLSFALSIGIHALIFGLASLSYMQSADFGMSAGHGGELEVDLTASSVAELTSQQETHSEMQPISPPPKHAEEVLEHKSPRPAPRPAPPQPASPVAPPHLAPAVAAQPGNSNQNGATRGSDKESSTPGYSADALTPVYPERARRKGIEGTSEILAYVDAHGNATEVTLQKSSGSSLLDNEAIRVVSKYKFKPAVKNGVPFASKVNVPIKFNLKNEDD